MKIMLKRIFIPTLLVAWTLYYFLDVLHKDAKTGALIKPLSLVVFVLYVIIMIGEVRRFLKQKNHEQDESKAAENKAMLINLLICLAVTAAYIIAMPYLGFVVSTSIFLSVMYLYAKAGRIYVVIPCSIAIAVVLFILFAKVLNVPLPVNGWGF